MKDHLLLACFLFTAMTVCAQETFYYDKFFKTVTKKKTPYYRAFDVGDKVLNYTEYCNDTLMAKGRIMPGNYHGLENELAHYVRSQGNPYQFKKPFHKMKCEVEYYLNEKPSRKTVWDSNRILHAQVWSETGEPLLENGNGKRITTKEQSTFHELYQDSLLIEMYEVRQAEQDSLYYTFDKVAEPKQGYTQFVEDLIKILKYPAFAQILGKQGLVYVQFIIDKEGKLTEFTPLTSEGFNMEKKVIDKLSQMEPWNPSRFRGRPVKMKFTIPVRFKLT
jgi:TonB family protein